MDRDGHGHHGKYEGNKYSLNYLPFTKEQKFLLNTYDMIKLNLLNLFGLLKVLNSLSFHVFCLLILMLLKKTIESDFLAPTVFTIIWNQFSLLLSSSCGVLQCDGPFIFIYFHLCSFLICELKRKVKPLQFSLHLLLKVNSSNNTINSCGIVADIFLKTLS